MDMMSGIQLEVHKLAAFHSGYVVKLDRSA
jgi:hypothetical protein